MVTVEINGKDYQVKSDHKDFTIQDYIDLRVRLNSTPENLIALYKNYATKKNKGNEAKLEKERLEIQDAFTKEDLVKTLPIFYADILGMCSDIPEKIMKKIDRIDREKVYNQFCLGTVAGLLFEPKRIEPIKSFMLDGEKLEAPEYYEILGQNRPMGKAQVIEFAESSDLELFADELDGGKYEVLPNMISILYRPKGEEYDEAKSLKRVEKMKGLTMDLGWGVFFYLKGLGILSLQITQTLQAREAIRELKRQLLNQELTSSVGTEA